MTNEIANNYVSVPVAEENQPQIKRPSKYYRPIFITIGCVLLIVIGVVVFFANFKASKNDEIKFTTTANPFADYQNDDPRGPDSSEYSETDDYTDDPEEDPNNEQALTFTSHRNYQKFASQSCGLMSSTTRIQNSNTTQLFEHPWMVVLMNYKISTNKKMHLCGASLISDQLVLTAAHCITSKEDLEMHVYIGEYNTETDPDCEVIAEKEQCAEPIQIFTPSNYSVVVHSEYEAGNKSHDIAIIKLNTPVKMSESVKPICLPFDDEKVPEVITVIGYGKMTELQNLPTKLRQGTVYRVDQEKCVEQYKNLTYPREVTNDHFCAYQKINKELRGRTVKTSVDTCQGDSGSPAIYPNSKSQYCQYGIVSFGEGAACFKLKAPGVYVKVHSYLGWILDNADTASYSGARENFANLKLIFYLLQILGVHSIITKYVYIE